MEAAEVASLEAAIGWLVQTILANLLIDKLDAWIRQVGLADDIEKLKSEIERIDMVVAAVNGIAIGNKPLARSLTHLKELLYDADDVVDELDYYRLQQQVEGVTCDDPESMHGAEHLELDERSRGSAAEMSSNGDNLRSKCWKEFTVTKWEKGKAVEAKCIHCDAPPIKCGSKNGTSVLSNHLKSKGCTRKRGATDLPPNPSSTVDATSNATPAVSDNSSSRKRRRTDEESAEITAASTQLPWSKAALSNGIQEVTRQLQVTRGLVSEVPKIPGSSSVASSHHCRSTTSDQHLRTSSLIQRTMYGRAEEKEYIIKLMTEHKSGGVTVLPIVGIGGIGKTALAQLVYNDPTAENQFERIWVWVSANFDEVRLSREMLDFVSQERHEGINCFAKLQEILKCHIKSKRVLLILDDVWDDMNDCRWNQLLAPFKSNHANGHVILVTTRKLSVAKRTGTAGPIKLGALESDDFRLLFKSCAFGDGNYEGPGNLSTIGRQIEEKLKGNPLAAVTAGALLRDHLTVDHWSNILKKENWKSLGLSGGIMPALKLSYDHLPYHLRQCISYCSIFPENYRFIGDELVYIWISQGFVNCIDLSKRLEEIGWDYLNDLVNLGFFQQDETCYVICGLMHELAKMVSRTECATIDGLQCNEMLPTIRHLSILTGSGYVEDQQENVLRNVKFEKQLHTALASVRKLRTLVLIGQYDSFFFQSFRDIFQKTQNLRLLQISATSADFNSFLCSLVNHTHLRYLKLKPKLDRALPQVLSKFCHLQVLDVGSYTHPTLPHGTNNLISLRQLVAEKEVCSFIDSIGKMTSLQELHYFRVQNSSGFELTQLQSMNQLVQLGVSQLENVKSREEAYGAKLTDKRQLEKLHLLWTCTSSRDEYDSGTSFQSSVDILEIDEELLPSSSIPSSEPSSDTAREVIEGLEPHVDLKHLQISGYKGATSPTWLASNIAVTSLQTLHLENCGNWQILPSMEMLPFLTKLSLSNMRKTIEVSVPSLEELVLVKMPKLERCSCTSVGGLNSSLRALQIEKCHALMVFDLFENDHKFEMEQKSWLPGLRKLILRDCPHLEVLNPLPPSTAFSELLVNGVSTLPSMEGSSSETLYIGSSDGYDEYSDELRILDDRILAFHNLRSLRLMIIHGCRNLTFISFEGFSHLVSLKSLTIDNCEKLFSSDVLPERTCEDMLSANCKAFPSLKSLAIDNCGIAGKWLPLMLRHAPDLEELIVEDCQHITTLLPMEEGENTAREDSSSGDPDDALTGLAPDGVLHIPLNPTSSLKRITLKHCPRLTLGGIKESFCVFTALEKLVIAGCPEMLSSLVHRDGNDDQANGRWLLPQSLVELGIYGDSPETLQPCFPRNLTCLKKLQVRHYSSLESLQLHFCTALEELTIIYCESLAALEGLQSLGSLTRLEVRQSSSLESLQLHVCTALEELTIKYCESLAALEGLQSLGSLKKLRVRRSSSLESLQLHFYTVLEELAIRDCDSLTALEGLQSLGSLTRLKVEESSSLKSVQLHFCTALEELTIKNCESLAALQGLQSLGSLTRLEVSESSSLESLQLHFCTALEELTIMDCESLAALEGLQSLGSLTRLKVEESSSLKSVQLHFCTALEELTIKNCESLAALQGLQSLGSLTRLEVSESSSLESLQLHFCTALEELTIMDCESLAALEGLQSLDSLTRLVVLDCPGLPPWWESFSRAGYALCPRLETLVINDPSVLTTSLCKHLTSLKGLELYSLVLTDEQERALVLLKSLQELEFTDCYDLVDLPAGLHTLPSLKRLKLTFCLEISMLSGTCLPPSLEELEIEDCSEELDDQCKLLATSKLNVKIT